MFVSTNALGDVIGLYGASGDQLVKYEYDAWGKVISETDANGNALTGTAATFNEINPFRYRGYYYDSETGLYYLQSRYYDPEVGRFVNEDKYISTGTGILGFNMFAYCNNNPIMHFDPTGEKLFECCPYGDCDSCQSKLKETVNNESYFDKMADNITKPKENGNTVSVGISVGHTAGNYNASNTYVISSDTSYNYALQKTESSGVSTGAGGSIGFAFGFTNATNVQDLSGKSESIGFTAGSFVGISVDYVTFSPASNPNESCWGINFAITIGGEIEVHKAENYTISSDSWNPFK